MTPLKHSRESEEGYLLVGLVVACFLILLALSVAAPRVAKELERDREVESAHRAEEYVRAIQLYYKKNNSYPTSIDQLVGASGMGTVSSAMNVRYLRQRYKDPLTNDEYRLIHVGEAQTTVKGFFGEELQGLQQGNLGAAAGMVSNLGGAGTTPQPGVAGAPGIGSPGSPASSTAGAPASPSGTGSATTAGATGTGATGSTDATTFQGSKGAIMGVGSNAKGSAIVAWNGSEDISQWEFLYDPRVELLKAKVSLFGGTPAAGGGGLGNGFAPISGATGQPGGTGSGGITPTGASPGFGTPAGGSTPSSPVGAPMPQ